MSEGVQAMKHFNRGDFVRIAHSSIFGVVTEVVLKEGKIEYLVLNIEGKYERFSGEEIDEITRVRALTFQHG